ncbi:unnamed protein product [Durusdinium trenchii]|uniref:Glycosyltransferase 2-like domain-containing protein n=1 Tax=Durusdinium trenchii TaxID=1381693 RepID=A0ABP0JMD4_9DINO
MAASVVPPTVAVIIPAMNEEKSLPTTLQSVLAQKPSPQEIVVVDPGSTDRTSEVASECGAQVLTSPRGRAVQMNAGARNTKALRMGKVPPKGTTFHWPIKCQQNTI